MKADLDDDFLEALKRDAEAALAEPMQRYTAAPDAVLQLVAEVRRLRDPSLQAFYSRPDLARRGGYWRKMSGGISISFSPFLIRDAGGIERLETEWEWVP